MKITRMWGRIEPKTTLWKRREEGVLKWRGWSELKWLRTGRTDGLFWTKQENVKDVLNYVSGYKMSSGPKSGQLNGMRLRKHEDTCSLSLPNKFSCRPSVVSLTWPNITGKEIRGKAVLSKRRELLNQPGCATCHKTGILKAMTHWLDQFLKFIQLSVQIKWTACSHTLQ